MDKEKREFELAKAKCLAVADQMWLAIEKHLETLDEIVEKGININDGKQLLVARMAVNAVCGQIRFNQAIRSGL